jgi:ferredoxin--NADP+ reductase
MYRILSKARLNKTSVRIDIQAPLVAKKARVGQFIILRAGENSKRIPFTIMDSDAQTGSVSIIYQVLGAGTIELDQLNEGDSLHDFVGPLGEPSWLTGLSRVCVVGGGLGCAIAYPSAKQLKREGAYVEGIIGFRNAESVLLENEFNAVCDRVTLLTDDGSAGRQGFVTKALEELLAAGERYDEVLAIGPLPMMKAVSALTKRFDIKTTVSMNAIMVDGTGMCGGCRLSVGGRMKFACVDGPEFDGHLVDFDEAIARGGIYKDFEARAREEACRLLEKEAP